MNKFDLNGLCSANGRCQVTIVLGHGRIKKQDRKTTTWESSDAMDYLAANTPAGSVDDTEKIGIVSCGKDYTNPSYTVTNQLQAKNVNDVVRQLKNPKRTWGMPYNDGIQYSVLNDNWSKLMAAAEKDAMDICESGPCCPEIKIMTIIVDDENGNWRRNVPNAAQSERTPLFIGCGRGK